MAYLAKRHLPPGSYYVRPKAEGGTLFWVVGIILCIVTAGLALPVVLIVHWLVRPEKVLVTPQQPQRLNVTVQMVSSDVYGDAKKRWPTLKT